METRLYEIKLNDGRIFRVFCANSTQKLKFLRNHDAIKNSVKEVKIIVNGIHTYKQWGEFFKTISKNPKK